MNALEASGLSKRYGKKWALENCSFELPAGSIAGLVGPNGAGKTTLLHIAVGLLEPTRGSLRILGEQPGADRVERGLGGGGVFDDGDFVHGATASHRKFNLSSPIALSVENTLFPDG